MPTPRSGLFYLTKLQFYGRRAPEDQHRHIQAALFVIHILNDTIEVVERTIDDPNHLAGLENGLGLGLINTCFDPLQNGIGLRVRNRRRLVLPCPR